MNIPNSDYPHSNHPPEHSIALPIGELKTALTGLGKVINRRATLPVLLMMLVERRADGCVYLTTTDLERFASVRFDQRTSGKCSPLSLLVPFEELLQVTKACPRDEIIHLIPGHSNKHVTVRFPLARKTGENKLRSMPVTEFPAIPQLHGKAALVPDHVRHHLHEAMSCVSTDASRYVLNGAYIDVAHPDASYLVGTDGTHLYSSNSFHMQLKTSVILPPHRFLGWRPFNQDGEWQVKVGVMENAPVKSDALWLQIQTTSWFYISKVIEGQYPRWKQVVPDMKLTECRLTLHPDSLEELIKEIELLPCADEKFRAIGLEWYSGKLHLLVRESREGPWLRILVEQARGEGKDVTVFCNRLYLIKALRFGLNSIQLINEVSPLRFSQGGRQLIVMPIRTEAVKPLPAQPPKSVSSASAPERACNSSSDNLDMKPVRNPAGNMPIKTEDHTASAQVNPCAANRPADVFEETLSQLNGLRDCLRQSLGVIGALSVSVRHLRSNQRHLVRDLRRTENGKPLSPRPSAVAMG